MNFNSLVFPAPKPSYNTEILGNELIWIPSYKFPNGNKSTQSQQKKLIILKNEKKDLNLSDLMFIEDPDMENSIPNYMTPQASISKKFDFDSYNKRFNDSKYKTSGNNTNNQLEHNSYENYEEKDADFKPKNIEQYYTKTLDHMNAFTKYSSNNNSVHRENTNHQSFNSKINASYIPSLLLEVPLSPNPKHIVLFFHGNGEDIFLAYELIDSIRQTLKVRVIAPEYPTYGVYSSDECTSEKILSDAETCYNYLINVIGYSEDQIIIIGRSIGTGPATYIAGKRKPGALILLSGFTSLQGVVQNYAGSIKHLIKERFVNIENMKKVTCPTLLIHGIKDKLISYTHSLKLHDACKGPCELQLPKEMSHFEFDFEDDMSYPVLLFLIKWGFHIREMTETKLESRATKIFPIEVYFKPYN